MNIDDRLFNWAIYYSMTDDGRPIVKKHCGSAEHNFKGEVGEVFDDEDKFIEPDKFDAEKLEKKITKLKKKDRRLIKFKYILFPQHTNNFIANKLRISEEKFINDLRSIKLILNNKNEKY